MRLFIRESDPPHRKGVLYSRYFHDISWRHLPSCKPCSGNLYSNKAVLVAKILDRYGRFSIEYDGSTFRTYVVVNKKVMDIILIFAQMGTRITPTKMKEMLRSIDSLDMLKSLLSPLRLQDAFEKGG